jgi:acyl carrier protein
MKPDEFLRLLESTLGQPAGSISPASRLDALGWDSMSELSFIAMADSKLGVQVAARAIAECTTVADLVKLLGAAVAT